MGCKENDAPALFPGLVVILKSVIDDQSFDIIAIEMWKVGEIGQHPPQVAKLCKKHSPPLFVCPIRKSNSQVEKAHAAQAGPESIAECRQEHAKAPGQLMGKPSQQGQDGSSGPEFNSVTKS